MSASTKTSCQLRAFFFLFAEVLVGPFRRKQAWSDMRTRINLRTSIVVYRARAVSVSDDQTLISPCADAPNSPLVSVHA